MTPYFLVKLEMQLANLKSFWSKLHPFLLKFFDRSKGSSKLIEKLPPQRPSPPHLAT